MRRGERPRWESSFRRGLKIVMTRWWWYALGGGVEYMLACLVSRFCLEIRSGLRVLCGLVGCWTYYSCRWMGRTIDLGRRGSGRALYQLLNRAKSSFALPRVILSVSEYAILDASFIIARKCILA